MFGSALISLALFTVAAQAGKRGLAWPWYNSPLNPGVFNNGDGEVVAIYDWGKLEVIAVHVHRELNC